MRDQWLNQSKLSKIQDKKLKNLVEYAYHNVNYYRKLFNHIGITPFDIQTVGDIQKIPITNREDIRGAPFVEVVSKVVKMNRYIRYTTSGTTNEPIDVFLSKNEETLQGMFYLRMLFANGYNRKDRLVILTHPQFVLKKKKKAIFQHLGIFEIKYISIFQNPKEYLEDLLRIKPTIIRGYAPIIKSIALEMQNKNIKEIRPRLIFCTAEFLSKDDRDFISSVFEAEVIDYYSSTECGLIAWECRKHEGYHINCDNAIVELINDNRKALPGERGEVIVTTLNSYTMPFIRYKIGDIATLSSTFCSCNRTLPLIKTIYKRTPSKLFIK